MSSPLLHHILEQLHISLIYTYAYMLTKKNRTRQTLPRHRRQRLRQHVGHHRLAALPSPVRPALPRPVLRHPGADRPGYGRVPLVPGRPAAREPVEGAEDCRVEPGDAGGGEGRREKVRGSEVDVYVWVVSK